MPSFFIAGDDGEWKSMGIISEDGVTLSTFDDAVPKGAASAIGLGALAADSGMFKALSESIVATIEHVDEDAIRSLFDVPEISQGVGFELECVRKRRKDVLRECAELVGGQFLRNYLRSQRISRRNSGTGRDAAGGVIRRRVIFPDASIAPTDSGELVVSARA